MKWSRLTIKPPLFNLCLRWRYGFKKLNVDYIQNGQTEKLTAPNSRGNPPHIHAGTTVYERRAREEHWVRNALQQPISHPPWLQPFPGRATHQHKPKLPHLKHCRQTCTARATQCLLRHFQNLNFSKRKGSTVSGVGWGPQQKSVKPTSRTAPILYCSMRLNSTCTWLPLSRPCFITHRLLAPKANTSTPCPQNRTESLTAQLGCDRHAEEKNVCCTSVVLPSNPSNLEAIRIETWKKSLEAQKNASMQRNTFLVEY